MTLQGFYDMEIEKAQAFFFRKTQPATLQTGLVLGNRSGKTQLGIAASLYHQAGNVERGTKQEQQELASLYEASIIQTL